ncbi:hypothetical protein [Macrococcus animalis]
MDYYQLMSHDIIEQNFDYNHIELLPNQSRFLPNDELNHDLFD